MNLYRYETLLSGYGPELVIYTIEKETPKGYWIVEGTLRTGNLRHFGKWMSKNSRRPFAHTSKEEALRAYIIRQEWRYNILHNQLTNCKACIKRAKESAGLDVQKALYKPNILNFIL